MLRMALVSVGMYSEKCFTVLRTFFIYLNLNHGKHLSNIQCTSCVMCTVYYSDVLCASADVLCASGKTIDYWCAI